VNSGRLLLLYGLTRSTRDCPFHIYNRHNHLTKELTMSQLMNEILKMADKVNKQVADANKTKTDTLKDTCKNLFNFFVKFDEKFGPALDAALGNFKPTFSRTFKCDRCSVCFLYNGIKIIYGKYQRNYESSFGHFLEIRDDRDECIRILSDIKKAHVTQYAVDTRRDDDRTYSGTTIYDKDIERGEFRFSDMLEPVFPTVDKLLTKPNWKTLEALLSGELLKILARKTQEAEDKIKIYQK